MLYKAISFLDKVFSIESVSAHCDIPCKIYDPITAQISVLTMIRLVDLIDELAAQDELSLSDQAKLSRLVKEKEEHGLQVKEEVRVIWGDYFKQPQFDAFPETNSLVHTIMLQASKAKQGISREDSVVLLDLVNEFAASFWSTKGVETHKAICPYPPSLEVVYPKL